MNQLDNEYTEWLDEREKEWLEDEECFEAFLEDLNKQVDKHLNFRNQQKKTKIKCLNVWVFAG